MSRDIPGGNYFGKHAHHVTVLENLEEKPRTVRNSLLPRAQEGVPVSLRPAQLEYRGYDFPRAARLCSKPANGDRRDPGNFAISEEVIASIRWKVPYGTAIRAGPLTAGN